jgi:DNA-binding NtrC family response regulator
VAVVITGYGTVKDAVEAIKRGASDFIAKPFQFDELIHVLEKALEQRRLTSRTRTCVAARGALSVWGEFSGRRPMQDRFTCSRRLRARPAPFW